MCRFNFWVRVRIRVRAKVMYENVHGATMDASWSHGATTVASRSLRGAAGNSSNNDKSPTMVTEVNVLSSPAAVCFFANAIAPWLFSNKSMSL